MFVQFKFYFCEEIFSVMLQYLQILDEFAQRWETNTYAISKTITFSPFK